VIEKSLKLSPEREDKIWEDIIELFSEYELYGLIGKTSKRIKNPKASISFLTAKSLLLDKETIPQALEVLNKLLK